MERNLDFFLQVEFMLAEAILSWHRSWNNADI